MGDRQIFPVQITATFIPTSGEHARSPLWAPVTLTRVTDTLREKKGVVDATVRARTTCLAATRAVAEE